MKLVVGSLVAVLAGGAGAASHATLCGGGGDPHVRIANWIHGADLTGEQGATFAEAHLDAMAERLELRPEQRKAVAVALLDALPALESKAAAVGKAHAEQLQGVRAPVLDEQALRDASARAGVAQGELAIEIARLLRRVHGSLDPVQLETLDHGAMEHLHQHLGRHCEQVQRSVRSWAERQ